MLIKSAVAAEQLADVDAAVLDKTGTLTVGEPVVVAASSPSAEMADTVEHGITYGYLANPDIDVVDLVAVGAEVVDPREAWLHTFGDEAYAPTPSPATATASPPCCAR